MSKKTFSATLAEVEIVTFQEFLKHVKRITFKDRMYAYDDLYQYTENPDDANYRRRAALLVRGSERKIALANLLALANHGYKWKMPIGQFYEDIVVEHAMNFGLTRFVVKLGSRRYMAADPEDFAIVSGPHGVTMICTATARLHVYEMMPITEEEALKRHKKHQEANPLNLDEIQAAIDQAQGVIKKCESVG